MTETTKAPKKETVREEIKMEDGQTISFTEKQKASVDVISSDAGDVIQFAFRTGQVRLFPVDVNGPLYHMAALHGFKQKLQDCYANQQDPEDAILAFERTAGAMLGSDSAEPSWNTARETDGLSGTSILIRALIAVGEKLGKPKTREQAETQLKAMTPEARKVLEKMDLVKTEMDRIKAEREAKREAKSGVVKPAEADVAADFFG